MHEMMAFFKSFSLLGAGFVVLLLVLKWTGQRYLERKLMKNLDPRRSVAIEQAKDLVKDD